MKFKKKNWKCPKRKLKRLLLVSSFPLLTRFLYWLSIWWKKILWWKPFFFKKEKKKKNTLMFKENFVITEKNSSEEVESSSPKNFNNSFNSFSIWIDCCCSSSTSEVVSRNFFYYLFIKLFFKKKKMLIFKRNWNKNLHHVDKIIIFMNWWRIFNVFDCCTNFRDSCLQIFDISINWRNWSYLFITIFKYQSLKNEYFFFEFYFFVLR